MSYDLADGSRTKRVMEAFTGAGLMAFSLANVLLPEVTARISRQYYAHFDAAFSLRGGIGLRTAYKAAATTVRSEAGPGCGGDGAGGGSRGRHCRQSCLRQAWQSKSARGFSDDTGPETVFVPRESQLQGQSHRSPARVLRRLFNCARWVQHQNVYRGCSTRGRHAFRSDVRQCS